MKTIDSETAEKIKGVFGDKPIFYLKFSSTLDHLKSLQAGNLYMNNLQYFVDLEENSGVAGMGDKMEALSVLNDVNISFYIPETDKLVAQATAKKANFRYDEAMTKPVFCLFAVTADMLELVNETETSVELKLSFTKDELTRMQKDFGEYVLLISEPHLKERLEKAFNGKGYQFYGKKAEYLDFTVNEMERIRAYAEKKTDLFFFKDQKFAHQREFRIVILNRDEEKAITENIGSLEDVSLLTRTEELGTTGGWDVTLNLK